MKNIDMFEVTGITDEFGQVIESAIMERVERLIKEDWENLTEMKGGNLNGRRCC